MKKEAELNAESDKAEREKVEKLNQADNMIFQTEKQIKEFGDKLSDDNRSELESVLNVLKESHKNKDVSDIDNQLSKLNETWNKISTELYSKTQTDNNTENTTTNTQTEQETQDVPYEEIK